MNRHDFRGRNSGGGRNNTLQVILIVLLGILIVTVLTLCGIMINKKLKYKALPADTSVAELPSGDGTLDPSPEEATASEPSSEEKLKALLSQAEALSLEYDYDGAISLLQSDPDFSTSEEVTSAVAGYNTAKEALVRFNPQDVTHVFFPFPYRRHFKSL